MPSSDPPIPAMQSVAPNTLSWTAVSGSLGRFQDSSSNPFYFSAIGDSTVGTVIWKLDSTAPSGGNVEALFTSTVANVLQNGTVDRVAGTITYAGHTYKVPQYWNGSQMTAILE